MTSRSESLREVPRALVQKMSFAFNGLRHKWSSGESAESFGETQKPTPRSYAKLAQEPTIGARLRPRQPFCHWLPRQRGRAFDMLILGQLDSYKRFGSVRAD